MAAGRTVLFVLVFASCAQSPEDACLRDEVSISSGIYGVIRRDCEIGGGCDATHLGRPYPGMHVGLFPAGFDPQEGDPAIADDRSRDDGFYQLDVTEGTYNLCLISPYANNSDCLTVTPSNLTVRYDYIPDMVTGQNWQGLACED